MAETHGEKEKAFLLDALISGSGLFGGTVNAVVDKFSAAKRSQLCLSSSCRVVRVSQPLPHPPGSARPPVRSQLVE